MTINERAYKTYPITKDDWDNTIEWTTMADIKEDKCEAYIQGANDQIDLLRNALIERQGEYISLELIKEIFEDYDND